MNQTVHQTKGLLEAEGPLEEAEMVSLTEGLARWDSGDAFDEEWLLSMEIRKEISGLLFLSVIQ